MLCVLYNSFCSIFFRTIDRVFAISKNKKEIVIFQDGGHMASRSKTRIYASYEVH